jgi:integrase
MNDNLITVWIQQPDDRPNFMFQWIDPTTGKRKSKSAGTDNRAVAEMRKTILEHELNNGTHRDTSRMTWAAFRKAFETEYLLGCRPGTRRCYQVVLDSFERLIQPVSLRSINERVISQYTALLRQERGRFGGNTSPWTVKSNLQLLHTAMAWAVKQKLLPECPHFPTVKVPKTTPKPVPVEAFERLLDKADDQMKAYLLTGWLAGLRRNEALLLEWEPTDAAPWLDLGRRPRIWLPAGFVKGCADQWVPLDPRLAAVLDAMPRTGKQVFRFVSSTGQPLTPNGISMRIYYLAKAAGVKMSMKVLRRGFGSRYAGKVPAQVLQKLMRHANIRTTMDFYANIDAAVEEAVFGTETAAQHNESHNTTAETAENPGEM